jgi:phosphoglycolate phosphatase-like HAD superfamily hydrolase
MSGADTTQQPRFAVFDIDGVLADVEHRLHHLRPPHRRWRAFFAEAADDPPLDEGVRRAHEAARTHALVYVSGRPERLRRVTQTWLDQHGLPAGALLLRPNHDRRPARVLKPEVVARISRQGLVALVVDDDLEVCEALRALGYSVVHATWSTPGERLRRAQEDEGRT